MNGRHEIKPIEIKDRRFNDHTERILSWITINRSKKKEMNPIKSQINSQ